MPRQHPTAFRQEMNNRMLAGENVLSLVGETGVPEQTLHQWNGLGLVDAGLAVNGPQTASQVVHDAHLHIEELEGELAPVKAVQ